MILIMENCIFLYDRNMLNGERNILKFLYIFMSLRGGLSRNIDG